MKKIIFTFFIMLIAVMLFYINQVIELEHNISLFRYYALSRDFTDEEITLLRENEPLVYGGNINEPPLGIYYEENGQYLGLVVDYINAISIELGTTIVSQPMVWEQALDALSEGETDLCDMIPSEERGETFAFSDPLYNLRGLVVTLNANNEIYELTDLEGKTVGVQRGDYAIERIEAMGIEADFVYANNLDEALELLSVGKVEAVLGDEPVLWYYLNELSNRDTFRILEEPLYDEACVIAVPKEKEELIGVINKAIFNLRRKGTLDQIHEKWSGLSSTFYEDKSTEKLKLGLVILMLMMAMASYLVYLWNRSLKVLVGERTQELETIRNDLQITFDSMRTFLVVIGVDGRIRNINSAFLQYLEKNLASVSNEYFKVIPMLQHLNDENDEMFEKSFSLADQSVGHAWHHKQMARYEGKIYEVDIYPLKPENQMTTQVLVILEDRTNEMLEEQKIIRSNKMASIGQLASGIAHELRNPLGVIRNSTFILNDEYESEDTIKLTALNAINNSVNRASKIIDNLLKFSRLTHDKEEIINLYEIILEITQYFKKKFEENQVRLLIRCHKELMVMLNTDALRHILINLISNAVDAMPEGGYLEIGCDRIGDSIIIYVKDEGEGIPDTVAERIYDPFFTTKPAGKGTGLGLYIVYSEAQKINGDISMESIEGEGTTFTLSISQRSSLYE